MDEDNDLQKFVLKKAGEAGIEKEFKIEINNRLEQGSNILSVHKIVPKLKPTPKMIDVMQSVISEYKYKNDYICLWYGYVGCLAHEGSLSSSQIIANFCENKLKESEPFFSRMMVELLSKVGRGEHISKLIQSYSEIANDLLKKSELYQIAKDLDLSALKKMNWKWIIHFAVNDPPSYFGASHVGPWVRIELDPEYLNRPWKITVMDSTKGKTLISGPDSACKTNDLKLSSLKSFVELPNWIKKIELELNISFDYKKAYFHGSKSKKDKETFISWMFNL